MTEHTRAYLYRIALAAAALLVAYGIVGADEVDAWLELVAAALMLGPAALASRHTSTRRTPAE